MLVNSRLLLCAFTSCIIFIKQWQLAATSPVSRDYPVDEYRIVYAPDYWYASEEQEGEKRNTKRHTTWGELRKTNKKTDVFVSRGWGAGGMPFNVLYTPNMNQHKILRSVPDKAVFPPVAQPLALTMAQPAPYDLDPRADRKLQQQLYEATKPSGYRRHYSIIPQLFVSYGWGPLGK